MREGKKNTKKSKGLGGSIKSFLGGSLLASEKVMKQLPFVFYLVLLGMILITNRYWSEKTLRNIEGMQDSIKELKSEAIIYETELMKLYRPTEISKMVKERGLDLVEPHEPSKQIKVKSLDKE